MTRVSWKALGAIQGSSVVVLLTGFAASVLVVRLAVLHLGVAAWAGVAWVLGITSIPLLFELGVTPALTRELLVLRADGRLDQADALLLGLVRRVLGACLASVLVVSVAVAVARPAAGLEHPALCVFLGAAANALMLAGDLLLVRARVAARIGRANLCRAVYYASYAALVAVGIGWLGLRVEFLFAAQVASAAIYATLGWHVGGPWSRARPSVAVPWRRLAGTAAAEQVGRVQSSLLPAIERSVLLSTAGAAPLAHYDVALRLTAMVTALPAAMSGSLGPFYGAIRTAEDGRRARAVVRVVGSMTVALAAASWLVLNGIGRPVLPGLLGLDGRAFLPVLAVVSLGSGINVLSAVPVSFLYAAGQPRPVLAKNVLDLGVGVAAVLALLFSDSFLVFLLVRYLGFVVGVSVVWWSTVDKLR